MELLNIAHTRAGTLGPTLTVWSSDPLTTFSLRLKTAELTDLECPWKTFTEWMGGARKSQSLKVVSWEGEGGMLARVHHNNEGLEQYFSTPVVLTRLFRLPIRVATA